MLSKYNLRQRMVIALAVFFVLIVITCNILMISSGHGDVKMFWLLVVPFGIAKLWAAWLMAS